MFTVIYSFSVDPGHETEFKDAWRALTELIFEYEGSLGSRLHKRGEGEYIAYAQWPDKHTWVNSGSKLPDSAAAVRQMMRDSCRKIETLYELEVVDDLLKDR